MAVGNHDLTLIVAGCRRLSSRAAGAIRAVWFVENIGAPEWVRNGCAGQVSSTTAIPQ